MKTNIASRIIAVCLLAFVAAAVIGVTLSARNARTSEAAHSSSAKENRLVVHEWGTFTSIAGKDGVALEWRPLNGSSDLPKFVHTSQEEGLGLRHVQSKAELSGLIRMETPVLYFYSKR